MVHTRVDCFATKSLKCIIIAIKGEIYMQLESTQNMAHNLDGFCCLKRQIYNFHYGKVISKFPRFFHGICFSDMENQCSELRSKPFACYIVQWKLLSHYSTLKIFPKFFSAFAQVVFFVNFGLFFPKFIKLLKIDFLINFNLFTGIPLLKAYTFTKKNSPMGFLVKRKFCGPEFRGQFAIFSVFLSSRKKIVLDPVNFEKI